MEPRSRKPPAMTRRKTRALTASVRKRASGSRPGGVIFCRASATGGENGGSRAAMRGASMGGLQCYDFRSSHDTATLSVAQGVHGQISEGGQGGPRLEDGPADHGAARPPRAALDAARGVGAARGAAHLPRAAGGVRRDGPPWAQWTAEGAAGEPPDRRGGGGLRGEGVGARG